jgi:uncharacterized membrane protein
MNKYEMLRAISFHIMGMLYLIFCDPTAIYRIFGIVWIMLGMVSMVLAVADE